jgi:hypothetical protein
LKEDIQINGVREPIWIDYKGRILDGRHRLRAAHETGKTCTTYIYDDPDPLGFVVSLNFHRRHLTNRERAEIAAKIENFGHGGNRRARSRKMPSGSLKRTRAEAAKLMNVSARSVARAKARQKTGASPGRRAPATTPKPTKAVIKPSAKNTIETTTQLPAVEAKTASEPIPTDSFCLLAGEVVETGLVLADGETNDAELADDDDLVVDDGALKNLVHALDLARAALAAQPSALEIDDRLDLILEDFREFYPWRRRETFLRIVEQQLTRAKTITEQNWNTPAGA